MHARGAAVLCVLAVLAAAAVVDGQNYMRLPLKAPCYTGVAKLSLVADDCQDNLKQLAPLSRPFNPASHLPWDCLKEMLVSVEGCKVTIVSNVPASRQLKNFSCSWIEYQGAVVNETAARVSAWARPTTVARYVLNTADLAALVAREGRTAAASPKPPDWQEQLRGAFGDRGNALLGEQGRFVVLRQNNRRCNTTWEVTSGGVLNVGKVNTSSIGEVVFPSGRPFSAPWVVRGERPRPWLARVRAMWIALIVVVSVFGAVLLAALGFLFYRLFTAHRDAKAGAAPVRGSPFEDGIGHLESGRAHGANGGAHGGAHGGAAGSFAEADPYRMQGMGSLEHNARRHGTSGGL